MIRLYNIEAWVLRIVDQQKRNQPCEDSRVEMKSRWPDPQKVARLIAAHANAARGENILWIIGIDESEVIVGADNTELANWLPTVKACFDGVFPEVIDLNVPVDEKTVVALLFSTDRAPFVVKNNAFGKPDSGPVGLEVPWREGRSTRSARREDLIRLLVPISHQPSAEVLSATIKINEPSPNSSPSLYKWDVNLQLYVAPYGQDRVVIPYHKCEIVITVGEERISIKKGIKLSPPGRIFIRSKPKPTFKLDSITINSTIYEAIINGPGRLDVTAFLQGAKPNSITDSEIMLALRMLPVGVEKPFIIETNLSRAEQRGNENFLAKWEYVKG
ncbi:MAG: hypothetical protein A2167_06140 [Planctomycetes bacterium RBG_13_46_10]|nr:MAG: hypothetical protein A2167_06140 [Planctomycetes bacterium RBG_13_46_10]